MPQIQLHMTCRSNGYRRSIDGRQGLRQTDPDSVGDRCDCVFYWGATKIKRARHQGSRQSAGMRVLDPMTGHTQLHGIIIETIIHGSTLPVFGAVLQQHVLAC